MRRPTWVLLGSQWSQRNFEPLLTKEWSKPRASFAAKVFWSNSLSRYRQINRQLFSAYDFHHGTSAQYTLKDFESRAALNNPLSVPKTCELDPSLLHQHFLFKNWSTTASTLLRFCPTHTPWGVSTCLAETLHYPTGYEEWWSWPLWSSKLPPPLQMSLLV